MTTRHCLVFFSQTATVSDLKCLALTGYMTNDGIILQIGLYRALHLSNGGQISEVLV